MQFIMRLSCASRRKTLILQETSISDMRTLTIQIQNKSAMKEIHALEERHVIRIVKKSESDINSPAIPGTTLTLQAFKSWVGSAEAAPSISLKAAQSQWGRQRKKLQRLVTK